MKNLVEIFEHFRMEPTPIDQFEVTGRAVLEAKMAPWVAALEPIRFVMLGFPFKSINVRDKVLGPLPDLGEELTLKNFAAFNAEVKLVYEPGVNITIVSDGFIFNDLLGVNGNAVQDYKAVSIGLQGRAPVTWYDLNDFYTGHDLPGKREKVMKHFGVTPEKLEQEILINPDTNFLYRGMIKFMHEELSIKTFASASQLQKAAKKLTREMMFRNEAYSNLVREEFADHVRLSMHPSVNSGAKFSFKLIPGANTHHSAWHAAVVKMPNEFITMHRRDAEAAGYRIINNYGRPYNFEVA